MKLNPKWKNHWGIVMLLVFGYIGLADVYPALSPTEGDTFSEFMQAHPGLMMLCAYLAGHFWPTDAALKRIFREPV